MSSLSVPVAIWREKEKGETYAFPLYRIVKSGISGDTEWIDPTLPLISDRTWDFIGVLPAGTPVSNIRQILENKVKCTMAGSTVFTAAWAISESTVNPPQKKKTLGVLASRSTGKTRSF